MAPAEAVVSTFYPSYDWNAFGCHHDTMVYANGYGACTGTSMSAPYVAGVVGLVRSVNPLLTQAQVRDALITNSSLASSFDDQFGYGIPDTEASVAAVFGRAGGEEVKNRLTPSSTSTARPPPPISSPPCPRWLRR